MNRLLNLVTRHAGSRRRTGPSELEFPRLWQALGWVMVLAVVYLTLTSVPPTVVFHVWDKALHLAAYAVLMWWFRQSFAPRPAWVLFLAALGVLLEYGQGLLGVRLFEVGDMVANVAGVAVGLVLAGTAAGNAVALLDRGLQRLAG